MTSKQEQEFMEWVKDNRIRVDQMDWLKDFIDRCTEDAYTRGQHNILEIQS